MDMFIAKFVCQTSIIFLKVGASWVLQRGLQKHSLNIWKHLIRQEIWSKVEWMTYIIWNISRSFWTSKYFQIRFPALKEIHSWLIWLKECCSGTWMCVCVWMCVNVCECVCVLRCLVSYIYNSWYVIWRNGGGGFLKLGYPLVIIHFRLGFSLGFSLKWTSSRGSMESPPSSRLAEQCLGHRSRPPCDLGARVSFVSLKFTRFSMFLFPNYMLWIPMITMIHLWIVYDISHKITICIHLYCETSLKGS